MSSIRERLLGVSSDNSKSSIRDRLGLNSSYYKKEYENEISKRNEIQKNIQKSTYENGVQTTVTPFSTQRNILPVQEQTETTKNKKFQVTAGQDMLKKNKNIENKYQEIKQSDTYKKQIQELEDQSNKVGYAKYNYDKQRAAEDDIGWYDKSIGRLVDGFGNLIDYNGGLIKNENGNIQYLPTFNQMKNEKVQNEYDTMLGRIAGDVLYTSGKIAGSTLVNQVLPGVGSTMYYGKMFVDSTNQAISDGYDSSSATIYGLINVGFEYATGKLLGSATKGLTGGKASNYETLLNKAFSKIIKKPKIASILANAGSEATEEFVQEYLDNITKLAVLEKSTNIKDYSSIFTDEEILTDALYSAAVGGVTGGIFGTITGKDTNVDNDRLYKTYKEELEETKKNTTNTDTINKIDNIISNIDNQINTKSNTDTIISQINEYQALKKQNKLTKKQEVELKKLQEQLANIQNQNANAEVIDIINPTNVNNNTQESVPTVQDIVNMENRQKSNIDLPIFNNSNSNVELSLKEQQNSIIQNSNPVGDDYHTWIRSADDIKTFEETLNDSDYKEYFEAGEDFDETYTAEMARKALETGKITVYSSYPIEQGTFVSPSKMEAESYSGNGKVYSKEVNLTDVAWIDPTQGQYAKVSSKIAPVIDTTSVNNINTAIAPVDNNLSNKINQNNIKSDLNYSSNTSLSFSEQLDLWVQGKWNNRSQLVLFKHTPQLYLELGLKDNPITVSSSKLDRIINASGKQNGTYHNLGLETTKQLPNAIANPLNILESSTVDDSIVVVTELSDKEGRIVIVSMAIDGKGHIEVTDINNNKEIKRLNSNVMTSAYGRNNYEAWMESNRDRMIYDKDDGIIKKRINGEWLQLPKGINPFVDNNISQTNKNVKSSGTLSTINDMQNNENNTNNLAPVIDTTSVNNTNTVIVPVDVSQIKQSKGNIPINKELLNRYKSTNEMFNDYANNYNGEVSIKSDITELQNISVEKMKIGEVKKIAKEIFQKYNKSNIFYNDNNKILVNKTGIDESITKIFENRQQRELLKQHMLVFSDLGDIIEHSKLVNQIPELKGREKYNSWNYYYDGLKIGNNLYNFEFEVVSMSNGENHYRVQKLEKLNNKKTEVSTGSTNTGTLPVNETSVSYVNNIPQSNTNVKSSGTLSTINDMQNNKNNTNNLAPTREYFEGKDTNEQPEKLAQILKEKPLMENDKEGWLKKLATIKFIDKGYYVDKLARKTKNSELSSKYDYSLTANGIANHIIGNGRYDEKGNKIGKGLYEIFEPIENSGLLDDFSSYIYHKHNVDRMNLQNRFNEANKAVFGDGMTSEMSEQKVKEYESKYPEFETWANDIYEYNNANLEMLVKYGVISNEDMDYYNKKYPHYVPTIRQNSKQKTQMDFLLGKKASVNNPIKTAKGGNGDIIPLKDAMALRTMQTVNSSLRNNFGLELLNTVETEQIRNKENIDNIVEDINMEELITKGDKTKSATLTVFENGEKITFDISDEIYEALKPSNIYTVKWLNKFNNFRRGLLTEYNPTFMITNPIKDIQDGSINSKHPDAFAKNIIEAAKQIKNKGQYYQLYMANGGSYETYFNYNTGTNIVPSKIDKIAPLRKISEINEVIEMTPRLSEFISSIEAGESVETAMYNANEITTNFKRGGDITKTLDRNGVTFLNAGVQGTVKQIRNVQEARTAGIKGITKLAVRWTIAGLIPTLLMNMIWGDDDDYEELSDYVKNNYYIIGKYGDGKFIRIPKGRVTSVLQSFFQNMINGVNGEKLDLEGFIDLIENNLLPNNPEENNLLSPLVQAHNNTTWYGGNLVPTRLQNLPNAEQYDESIDSISIWLGKQLNISPYKINYVLDQYSGAIGDYILPYITQEAESGSDSFTGKLIAPVKDKFTVDSTLKNQNISDFYSLSEELTKKSNSSKATDEDILKNKYINSIKSDISKLYAEKRKIQSSSLKDSEKYNQSKEIQKEINELSKNALKDYKEVVSYGNYGKVFENEYYLNSKNEWTKVDDDEKEEIAKLKMSDSEKNEYFKTKVEVGIIKSNEDKTSKEKKEEIAEIVINSNLSDENKGYLYSKYYSSKETIDTILKSKISIDEFIKFNSQTFESDYYDNGKTVSNSRKKKVINYINSLNLSVAQKAILIKMEYSSYNSYNSQIVNYINKMDYSKYEKACILKQIGFDDYDSYIIETVKKKNISTDEKEEILENLGFKIRNGKVYSK